MHMLSAMLLLSLGLLLTGMRYVPEDTALTIRRFGRYARTLLPGFRYTFPLLDQVAHRVRLVGHQVMVPMHGDAATHASVYYQILEPERTGDALENVDALVGRQVSRALYALSQSQHPDNLENLALQLKHDLNHDLAALGLHVTRCNLRMDAVR